MKTVFLFDPTTGELTGSWDCQESPLEPGEFITPVHSTEVEPPAFGEKTAAVFDGVAWSVVADRRGEVWFSPETREPVSIEALGDPAEGGLVEVQPPPPFSEQKDSELSGFRARRETYLGRLSGLGFAYLLAGDGSSATAVGVMRQGLLDAPEHPDVVAATTLEELQAALASAYDELVAAAPTHVRAELEKVGNL